MIDTVVRGVQIMLWWPYSQSHKMKSVRVSEGVQARLLLKLDVDEVRLQAV